MIDQTQRIQQAAQKMSDNLQHRTRKERLYLEATPERQAVYLAEHAAERKLGVARLLIEAIDSWNIRWLIEKNNGCWESLWAAFTGDTGIKLPRTQKGIGETLRRWAGEARYAAALADKAADRAKKNLAAEAESRKWREQSLTRQAKSLQINSDGATIDGATYVDRKLAEGWRVENISRTRIPCYALKQGNTFVKLGRLGLTDYARMKEAQLKPDHEPTNPQVALFSQPAPTAGR